MRTSGKLLYFVCFAALAMVAALGFARIGSPSIAGALVWAALIAALAGAPGLVDRRAWPLALILLPAGAYLVMRAQLPVPAHTRGLGAHYDFYARQLRAAGHAYVVHTMPFDLTGAAGLRLLLALVVYGATGLAAFVALSLRKALPAVVVFLVLLGFGLTVDGAGRVVLLPLSFLVLAGCLLTLSRSLERRRWSTAGITAGAATAAIAALLALVLLAATPVASGRPWQNWGAWGLGGPSSSRLTFDWMLNFPSLLNPRADSRVMRVESPVASYWRANALDTFNGVAWLSGGALGDPLTRVGAAGLYTYAVPAADGEPAAGSRPAGTTVNEVFKVDSLYSDFLFAGGTPQTVVLDAHVPVFSTGAQALRLQHALGPRFGYALTAVVPRLKPADLVGRGRDYPVAVLPDTALPFPTAAALSGDTARALTGDAPTAATSGGLANRWRTTMDDTAADREWLGLYELNQTIVRGATDPYQITLRIEQYLRTNYTYSLTPPPSRYRSPYAAFLFDTRTGYCQHFAGAMAVLLRFNGIPARVAVGFMTGALVGKDTYSVNRTDAHAWVEVYFPQVGWVPFDPTPGGSMPGAGPSSTNAGFVDPFRQDRGAAGPAAAATAAPKLQSLPATARVRNRGAATGIAAAPSRAPHWLPWALGLAIALLVWPLARGAVRRRGLHRGSADRRLHAALALVYTELRDWGVGVPRSQTLEETAGFLKEYLGLDATALTARLEAVLFGGRAADERDLADIARLRRDLRRRLRARQGRLRGVLASYGVPAAPR